VLAEYTVLTMNNNTGEWSLSWMRRPRDYKAYKRRLSTSIVGHLSPQHFVTG